MARGHGRGQGNRGTRSGRANSGSSSSSSSSSGGPRGQGNQSVSNNSNRQGGNPGYGPGSGRGFSGAGIGGNVGGGLGIGNIGGSRGGVTKGPNVGKDGFNLGGWNTKLNEHGGKWGFAASAGKDPKTGKPYTAGQIHKALKDFKANESKASASLSGVLTPGGIKNPDFVPANIKKFATDLGISAGKKVADWSATERGEKFLSSIDENPDSWKNKLLSGTIDTLTQGARDYAREQPGLSGLIGGIQAGKLERRLDRGDLTEAFRTIRGTYSLAEQFGGKLPTIRSVVSAPFNWAVDKISPRRDESTSFADSLPSSLRNLLAGDNGRDLVNSMGNRSGGNMSIRSVDVNKIGNQTNPYLTSGQSAQDEARLREFWVEQDRLNKAAEEELQNIQTDRSTYDTLVTDLGDASTAYTDEISRIQPYGKQYSDEIARLKPYGKQYSDEIARLKPFDKQFTSYISDLKKGRDELKGYQGQWTHPDDIKFLNENIPAYDKAISDLSKQYKTYKKSVSDLTKGQKDYQAYLKQTKAGQKEYLAYSDKLQTGKKQLSDYTVEVDRQRGVLEDYATAFTAAKEQSDKDAKSYTIRSQQNISSGLKSGISGVRAQGGLRTIGRDKSKSPKRRFNRDFRIGSFGDTSMSPINV